MRLMCGLFLTLGFFHQEASKQVNPQADVMS